MQEIVAVQQQAQAFVAARITDVLAARRPLRKVKLKREMKQYNPRFEDEYAAGKSYDPDRCVLTVSRHPVKGPSIVKLAANSATHCCLSFLVVPPAGTGLRLESSNACSQRNGGAQCRSCEKTQISWGSKSARTKKYRKQS